MIQACHGRSFILQPTINPLNFKEKKYVMFLLLSIQTYCQAYISGFVLIQFSFFEANFFKEGANRIKLSIRVQMVPIVNLASKV